jgi:hypothetical protein
MDFIPKCRICGERHRLGQCEAAIDRWLWSNADASTPDTPRAAAGFQAAAQTAAEAPAAAPQDQRPPLAEFTTEEIDAEYRRRHNKTYDRRTYMREYMRQRRRNGTA